MRFIERETHTMQCVRMKPDRSVRNVQGHVFANAMHDLHQVYWKRWKPEWNGVIYANSFQVTIHEPVRFWYIIDMTDKEIKFYMSAPVGEPFTFMHHRLNRYWPKATFESDIFHRISHENTDVIEIGLEKHNIFSLDVERDKDTTPIGDLLSVHADFREGDRAVIAYCFEPYDRVSWTDIADRAHAQIASGKVPKRASLSGRIDPMKALEAVNDQLYELHDLLFSGDTSQQEAKQKDKERNRKPSKTAEQAQLKKGHDFKATTLNKRVEPTFKGWLRVCVSSSNKDRRKVLTRSFGNAYAALHGDNALKARPVKEYVIDEVNDLHLTKRSILNPDVSIYSSTEVGKFIQLPTASTQDEYQDILSSIRVEEADIPSCFLDESGIYVGTSTFKGKEYDIHIPYNPKQPDTTMTSRGFIGSPRQGKDQALINLIVESKRKHGIGAVVLDWVDEHGKDEKGNQRGLSDAIRDSLEPDDFIDLQFGNYDWPIFFGAQMAVASSLNDRIAADKISKELSDFLMGEETDMHQTYEYLRDAAKVCVGDLLDIKAMFTNADFAKEKMERMEETNVGDFDMWDTYWNGMSDAQRAAIFSPVNMRLGQILNDEVLKPIFCQRPNMDLKYEEWITEGKVILLRMKVGESAKVLAHFATMTTFLIKIALDGKGFPTWLVINEPHQVQTKGFIKFMKRILVEGPKYRLAPVVAFHHLGRGHLWPEFVDTLSAGNISWHMFFNSNVQTYEKLKTYIEPTFTPETAMKQTQRFHFIAASWRNHDGTTQPAFMCKAPLLVKDRWGNKNHEPITKKHSEIYGKPITDVLADFRERNRPVKKKAKTEQQTDDVPVYDQSKTKKKPPKHVFMKH